MHTGNLLRYAIADAMCRILACAVEADAFARIARGADSAAELAGALGWSEHRAQALLDGLLGLGVVVLRDGRYAVAADAARYLIEGHSDDLRDFVRLGAGNLPAWRRLADAAQTGQPLLAGFEPDSHHDWERLVLAIAPLALAAARQAAEALAIETLGPMSMLDLGGGAGAFSAVWLSLNPEMVALQVDWLNVNALARRYVAGFGVGDRFDTRDGDARTLDHGSARHDVVVASLILHFFPPAQIVALVAAAHRALSPGGRLVIAEVMSDERRRLWPLAFGANMLLGTADGGTYARANYARWVQQAGFGEISFDEIGGMPHTLLYARK